MAISFPYLDMYTTDGSDVSFERWSGSYSVELHRHSFYELLIVDRGSCYHIYNGTGTLLIPGDAVLVSAHREHGISLRGDAVIYNCQYIPEALNESVRGLIEPGDILGGSETEEWQSLLVTREEHYRTSKKADAFTGFARNSSKQGVVHIDPTEYSFIRALLSHGLEEQESGGGESVILRRQYLSVLLLELRRVLRSQSMRYVAHSLDNQRMIAEVLVHIENNLTEQLDFNTLARQYAFSPNYFRKIFKDITGFSPVTYVNRMRIIRASECIRQGMSIHAAAEQVGIYDMNYFSRLFKKIMGCAPLRFEKM